MLSALLLLACTPPPGTPLGVTPLRAPREGRPASYDAVVDDLELLHDGLSADWAHTRSPSLVPIAREAILDALTQRIFPAWYGTPWAFYGTSEVPGQGAIACGYFVSTTLEHAGFELQRVLLAQQPAEHILWTFAPRGSVRRYRNQSVDTVIDGVIEGGDGLYLVGLDFHVGYLVASGSEVQMCHASYLADGVLCEDARSSAAMPSRYTVTTKLLDDAMVRGWLARRPFKTVTH